MYQFKNGQTSVILRVKLLNSSVSTGAGLTGLTSSSAGLIISTIADTEAAATAYTQAAGHIGTITTLGTYAAPSAGTCNFKEIDSTNHPGVYEIQLLNARFAVSGAKSLIVSISGATNLAQTDIHIQLTDVDPYSRAWNFQAQMTEGYAALNAAPTPEQAMFMIMQFLMSVSVPSTTWTTTKLNGSTTAMTFTVTLNSNGQPTALARAS